MLGGASEPEEPAGVDDVENLAAAIGQPLRNHRNPVHDLIDQSRRVSGDEDHFTRVVATDFCELVTRERGGDLRRPSNVARSVAATASGVSGRGARKKRP